MKLNTILDFLPLVIFFLLFKLYPNQNERIVVATTGLVIATILCLVITYTITKKIAPIPLVSGLLVAIFGTLTVMFHSDLFIKIKPTILNSILGGAILICSIKKKPIIKHIFASAITMSDSNWNKLGIRWGCFFICLAIVNEVVWRNFSTDFWVNFKLFGMLTMSILFTFSQLPFITKNTIK